MTHYKDTVLKSKGPVVEEIRVFIRITSTLHDANLERPEGYEHIRVLRCSKIFDKKVLKLLK